MLLNKTEFKKVLTEIGADFVIGRSQKGMLTYNDNLETHMKEVVGNSLIIDSKSRSIMCSKYITDRNVSEVVRAVVKYTEFNDVCRNNYRLLPLY